MIRYIKFSEVRKKNFKAWYNPSTDDLYQFSTNDLHTDISMKLYNLNDIQAVKKGYYRIYIVDNEINIDSFFKPDDREFNAVKFKIEKNTFPAKTSQTLWDIESTGKTYVYPKQSFFFADEFDDYKNTINWKGL